jgi:hypothetical protein
MLGKVFADLGHRMRNENHLSDVTWAFAQNSPAFLMSFAEVFGFAIGERAEISREVPLGDGGRVDFLIKSGDATFLIENKLYDINYHLREYKASPEGQKASGLAIIANHSLDLISRQQAEELGYRVAMWSQFAGLLQSKVEEGLPDDEKNCFTMYLEYLKEVCPVMEVKEFRLQDLTSLFYLSNLIESVIDEFQFPDLECKFYDAKTRYCGPGFSGHYMELRHMKSGVNMWPWLGIVFEPNLKLPFPAPFLAINCEWDWCKEVYQALNGKKYERDKYGVHTREDFVEFHLKNQIFDEFVEAPLARQREILADFLGSVVQEIVQYISGH